MSQSANLTTDRALQILQLIALSSEPLAVRQIAEQTGLPLSTLYRHLSTLIRCGLVLEIGSSKRYSVGPLSLQLSLNFHEHNTLAIQSRPEMHRLAMSSNETVGLLVATHFQVICIDMIVSRQLLQCVFSPGKGAPLHRGASAWALLAFMPQEQRNTALECCVPPEEHGQLLELLDEVRNQGYAESSSQLDEGVWGVSAPLLLPSGKLQGVITLMAPYERISEQRKRLTQLTTDAARRISSYLSSDN